LKPYVLLRFRALIATRAAMLAVHFKSFNPVFVVRNKRTRAENVEALF
jgi:hypothetical protein